MKHFSDKIIAWYLENKRDLPWRNTKDAYLIWLSEIILQQTRVDQGMAYYLRFASEFPTVNHLAKAKNDKVMKLWQGLGYYSRARNLHATAQQVSDKYKGSFPSEYNEILALKGIGEYTAAAIASFAFSKPHAVVDGNVYRVLSRVFGIESPIDNTKSKKEFALLANELLNKKKPGTHNQAIMEFGALYCKPANPDCPNCIFSSNCFAFANKKVASFPVKDKKTKVRNRYFNYLVLNYNGNTIIKKRLEKDIWINLFDFPLIETDKEISEEQFLKSKEWKAFIGKSSFLIRKISQPLKHVLSHQKIYTRFWEIEISSDIKKICPKNAIVIKQKDLQKFAVPRLIELYIDK